MQHLHELHPAGAGDAGRTTAARATAAAAAATTAAAEAAAATASASPPQDSVPKRIVDTFRCVKRCVAEWVPNPFAPLEFRISRLGGHTVTVYVSREGTVQEVKAAYEAACGVREREQRLIFETTELQNDEKLQDRFPDVDVVNVSLLRRSPLKAEWLDIVSLEPLRLPEAPTEVKEDVEVVLKAAKSNCRLLQCAAPNLWCERDFVLEAVKLDWRVWLNNVSPALRYEQDIVIAVLQVHGRALRYLPESHRANPDIILAALPQKLPDAIRFGNPANRRTIEALMEGHASFVFGRAAPELRSNREFLISAMKRDWRISSHAAPEMWGDRDFVLAAVEHKGLLLEKASSAIQADRDVAMKAVEQDGMALQFVAHALRGDFKIAATAIWQNFGSVGLVAQEAKRHPLMMLLIFWQRLCAWCRILENALLAVDNMPRIEPYTEEQQ